MRLLLVLGSLLLTASYYSSLQNWAEKEEAAISYEEPEAYKVYSAVVPKDSLWREAKTLVIQIETRGNELCIQPDEEAERFIGSAIADYERVNQKKWALRSDIDIAKPYSLIHYDEIYNILKEPNGWKTFFQHHPDTGGYIVLSAVGFNPDKTVAVMSMTHADGPNGAGGRFYVLEKTDNQWHSLVLKQGKWKQVCAWNA